MKTFHKDLIILFLYSISNTMIFIWPVIYPYLASYIKNFRSDITMRDIYSLTIGMFLGISISNLILSRLYFLFGIKGTMQIGGILYFLNCIFYFYFTSYIMIGLNIILTGMISQLEIMSVTYFLIEKYNKGSISNYVYIGTNIGNIIWPYVSVYLINPKNIGMDLIVNENGVLQSYYPWEISQNFPLLMNLIGLISCTFIFIPLLYLEDPPHIKKNFIPWLNAIFRGNNVALLEMSQCYDEVTLLNLSRNFTNSLKSVHNYQYDFEHNLLENEEISITDKIAEEKANKIIYSPIFILLVLLLSIRYAPLVFFIDNYKLISFNIINSDRMISFALSTSSFLSIIGQLLTIKIWKKFGFFKTHLLLFILVQLNLFIIIEFCLSSSLGIFWNLSLIRIINQIGYGSIYLTKYDLFHPKIAIHISKVIDMNYFIAMIIIIFLNYIFFSNLNISSIFWVFSFLNLISLLLFITYLKDFKKFIINTTFNLN